MSSNKKPASQNGGNKRSPVVLSKDEALYPPDKRAIKIAIAAGIIVVILTIVVFVLFPIG